MIVVLENKRYPLDLLILEQYFPESTLVSYFKDHQYTEYPIDQSVEQVYAQFLISRGRKREQVEMTRLLNRFWTDLDQVLSIFSLFCCTSVWTTRTVDKSMLGQLIPVVQFLDDLWNIPLLREMTSDPIGQLCFNWSDLSYKQSMGIYMLLLGTEEHSESQPLCDYVTVQSTKQGCMCCTLDEWLDVWTHLFRPNLQHLLTDRHFRMIVQVLLLTKVNGRIEPSTILSKVVSVTSMKRWNDLLLLPSWSSWFTVHQIQLSESDLSLFVVHQVEQHGCTECGQWIIQYWSNCISNEVLMHLDDLYRTDRTIVQTVDQIMSESDQISNSSMTMMIVT